jgi:hypothetical protein
MWYFPETRFGFPLMNVHILYTSTSGWQYFCEFCGGGEISITSTQYTVLLHEWLDLLLSLQEFLKDMCLLIERHCGVKNDGYLFWFFWNVNFLQNLNLGLNFTAIVMKTDGWSTLFQLIVTEDGLIVTKVTFPSKIGEAVSGIDDYW